MVRWRFSFGELKNIDGLIVKCLNSIPQYSQAYPAAKFDVSASLERMVENGFRSNENIVWHKITHGQRRYYLLKSLNGDGEVHVKIGHGVFGKAVRWNENGSLPGWKTIWSVFDVANYDVSERRIKLIHKIIQDNVIRELIHTDNGEDQSVQSTFDQSINQNDLDDHDEQNESYNVQQLLLSSEDDRQIQSPLSRRSISSSVINDSTSELENTDSAKATDLAFAKLTPTRLTSPSSSPKYGQRNMTACIGLDDSNKENSIDSETVIVDEPARKLTNSSPHLQPSINLLIHSQLTDSTCNGGGVDTKKKRQRRGGAYGLSGPWGLYVASNNTLYVTDYDTGRVQAYAPSSRSGVTIAELSGHVEDIFMDSMGCIYVADITLSSVFISPMNITLPIAIQRPCTSSSIYDPYGIAVDQYGNIYISDFYCNAVTKWAPNTTAGVVVAGQLNTAGSTSSLLNGPKFIALDEVHSALYVVDYYNYRVQKFLLGVSTVGITVAGGNGYGIGLNQLKNPSGVCVSSKDHSVYVGDQGNHRVMKWMINATQGSIVAGVTGVAGSTSSLLNTPGDCAFDAEQTFLYVADYGNHRVQRFTL
ncbi:unnamed protein product [Adineta ricciae]|uniref:Uncharacterized protein n=1 Tax=Adineta ricciae TaxID=249248 RepID=A0A814UGD7_ADIRI|nr:unnamed protein product [Adineta ricciae]